MDIYYIGIWEEFNFRFLLVDCTQTVREVFRRHELKNHSADLVAKAMVGAFFLAGMVKEETTVGIQLEGEGPIERVMAYSDRYGKMRAMAKHTQVYSPNDPTLGIGTGYFKVTRWGGIKKIHYSATKLFPVSFELNLLRHITDSDQLLSFLAIYTCDNTRGMFFQELPDTTYEMMKSLEKKISQIHQDNSTLFEGKLEDIIARLENLLNSKLTILEKGNPEFYCGCSLEKIKQVVIALGKEEALSILQERGQIQIICEFCKQEYNLDPEEVNLLFLENTTK